MNFANINHCWGTLIIEEFFRLGVDYFCVAPGSRSAPLVIGLAQHPRAQSQVHFDERGLGFHAMGYAAATHKPAVLICTSGTAAANFFPAVIEASKKKLPLIVLTADRPPELRQTGAVQTMDQVGLFGKYVQWTTDLPCPDLNILPQFVLTTIDQAWYQAMRHKAVVHINCMFRQPLSLLKTHENLESYTQPIGHWLKSQGPYTQYAMGHGPSRSIDYKKISTHIEKIKNGLIVVGKIGPDEHAGVLQLAQKTGWPVFADMASGLRLGTQHPCLIHYFDQLLLSEKVMKDLSFDGVLHLGGRITSKRYYEFIQAQRPSTYITVLNHALRNDPNHQVSLRLEDSVGHFTSQISKLTKKRKATKALKILAKANRLADRAIEQFFKQEDRLSEPGVARLVSQLIPEGDGLFLANSMPIRDMDAFADFKAHTVYVNGNRGTSGIDGLIASASGFARGLQKPVTLMIGDLAALHDLNSLCMLRDLPVALTIVILNNGGGGIFSFLPIAHFKEGFEKFWGTPHAYTFASLSAAFELNYFQPMSCDQFTKNYKQALKSNTATIIEVMTSRAENVKLHAHLQEVI